MKVLLRHLLFSSAVGIAAVLYADEAVQRKLGDAAFYAGDYRNAVSSYISALELADKENKPDGWAATALNLGVAYLHNGDIANAQRIYEEFLRRYPLRSAGTLPGDLLAATGKHAEAEKFFHSLLSGDPAIIDAAEFSLATLYLKTGRIKEAHRIFSRLAAKKDSPWQISAGNEAIYSLIRLARYSDALAEIGTIPQEKRNVDIELMQYLAEAYAGKTGNLEKNFRTFLEKIPPHPHVRLTELLAVAAETARQEGKLQFAVEALRQALAFSNDPKDKANLHKSLINILLAEDQQTAAEEACNYTRLYPAAVDRAMVVMAAAQQMKNQKNALKLYSFISRGNFTADEKITAAMEAADVAESTREFGVLEKISDFLSGQLPVKRKIDYQCRYAAYLEKNGKNQRAEKVLNNALETAREAKNTSLIENVMLELLNFSWRNKNDQQLDQWAAALENSKSAMHRNTAKKALGELLNRAGKYEEARKKFLDAANALPEKEAPSLFMAAAMAAKSFDYAVAAKEFFSLAVKYPDFAKTPEALFMAADLYSTVNDTLKANKAADILQEKYSKSQAFASLVLRNASEIGNAGDIDGALKELEKLEKEFTPSPVADEAAMLRGVFLAQSGKESVAEKIFRRLQKSENPHHAAESNLRLGEILKKRGELSSAYTAFTESAKYNPGSLLSDGASLRAGDCLMAEKMPLAEEKALKAQEIFEKLAKESKFAPIRLESLYKAGKAHEYQNRKSEALTHYENTIYTAVNMIDQGMIPEANWCEKSCEDALRLIAEKGGTGSLQRGMRLIERCRKLMLPDGEFTEKMRDFFRKELKQWRARKYVSGKVDK